MQFSNTVCGECLSEASTQWTLARKRENKVERDYYILKIIVKLLQCHSAIIKHFWHGAWIISLLYLDYCNWVQPMMQIYASSIIIKQLSWGKLELSSFPTYLLEMQGTKRKKGKSRFPPHMLCTTRCLICLGLAGDQPIYLCVIFLPLIITSNIAFLCI